MLIAVIVSHRDRGNRFALKFVHCLVGIEEIVTRSTGSRTSAIHKIGHCARCVFVFEGSLFQIKNHWAAVKTLLKTGGFSRQHSQRGTQSTRF